MKTLDELRSELKSVLAAGTYEMGSLYAHVDGNIQWAWDNWTIDFSEFFEGDEKPERYTESFRDEWIDCELFEQELEYINRNCI